jgi:hypothetical protein
MGGASGRIASREPESEGIAVDREHLGGGTPGRGPAGVPADRRPRLTGQGQAPTFTSAGNCSGGGCARARATGGYSCPTTAGSSRATDHPGQLALLVVQVQSGERLRGDVLAT